MKKIFTLLFFSVILQISFANLSIEGHYQGYNLFIQNPECATDTLCFCVEKVTVNGIEIHHDQASAFEIRLDSMGLKIGDPLTIVIFHAVGCKPKVLNTNYNHYPVSTFEIVSIEITSEGTLTWETKNETSELNYVVEQYRWNKWVPIGEVEAKGSALENTYSFDVIPHSGKNEVRVTQTDHSGKKYPSPEVTFTSTVDEVEIIEINQITKKITCSAETLYELYDDRGNMVKRGFGNQIDCSDLKPGIYFLNFDNKNEKVVLEKQKKN